MNREQAKKAILAIDPNALEWVTLDDLATSLAEAEEGADTADDPADGEQCAKILAVLRQHRDYLRTEDEAMAVWREVFVARCATAATGVAAADANDAETFFRRRLAEHLAGKG